MWERLSRREKILLALLLAAGVGFCLFRFFLTPQIKAYVAARKDLDAALAELSRYRTAAASLQEESRRLEKLREEVSATGAPFAIEMRNGADIILLGLAAAARNVEVTGVEPGKIKENQHTLELPLKITVEGSYPNLLAFCEGLESAALCNLTEIRSAKFEATSGSAVGAASSGRVKATLGLVIYSDRTPQGRLSLEVISKWLTGRYNVFQPAGALAPIPELAGHPKTPPVTAPGESLPEQAGGIFPPAGGGEEPLLRK